MLWKTLLAAVSGELSQELSHEHAERPQQGLDNTLIDGQELRPTRGDVRCLERLGGLLKFYYRDAA